MTGKLSKEEADDLRELAEAWAEARGDVSFAFHDGGDEELDLAAEDIATARAAFERRLAELTEG